MISAAYMGAEEGLVSRCFGSNVHHLNLRSVGCGISGARTFSQEVRGLFPEDCAMGLDVTDVSDNQVLACKRHVGIVSNWCLRLFGNS